MTCPDCNGKKELFVHVSYGYDATTGGCLGEWKWIPCSRCNDGVVADEQAAWIAEGVRLRSARVNGGSYRSMHEEAARLGIDLATYSKMERGMVKPYTLNTPTEPQS